MGAMGMVQVAIDQVISVIPVGYEFVAAVRAMNVSAVMPGTGVAWCTLLRIDRTHLYDVIVYVISMSVVQVTIV